MERAAAIEADAKKKSVIASEQMRPDVAQARDQFFAEQLKDVALKDVVVLDESYATTTFTRLRGRCPRNQRLRASVPHGHWKTLTLIAAITVQGILVGATIDAATDADVFRVFIQEVLVPALKPGMVVVMDNLAAHKVTGIRESIESAGCRLAYLPPYSPDLSPIENVWSKVKQLLRTSAAREVPTLGEAINSALASVTAQDCHNCFAACGYTLHLS
jgi:transposase